jgi:hypothetical protein
VVGKAGDQQRSKGLRRGRSQFGEQVPVDGVPGVRRLRRSVAQQEVHPHCCPLHPGGVSYKFQKKKKKKMSTPRTSLINVLAYCHLKISSPIYRTSIGNSEFFVKKELISLFFSILLRSLLHMLLSLTIFAWQWPASQNCSVLFKNKSLLQL